MKHRQGVGELKCRICDASFQMPIHHLHEPVDVFSEWLDECEAAEKRNNGIVDGGLAVGGSNDVDGVLAGAIGTGSGDKQAYDFDSDDDDDDDDDLLGTTSTSASGTGHKRTSGNNEASSSGQQKPQQTLQTLGVGDSDDDSY
jgi:transcription elongation factor Elf1